MWSATIAATVFTFTRSDSRIFVGVASLHLRVRISRWRPTLIAARTSATFSGETSSTPKAARISGLSRIAAIIFSVETVAIGLTYLSGTWDEAEPQRIKCLTHKEQT